MIRKSLIVFVISVFLFSAGALTDTYAAGGPTSGIEVYDADGQYLGLSGDSLQHLFTVYVPSISMYVGINLDNGWAGKMVLYYQNNDCIGIPYVRSYQTYSIDKVRGIFYTGARTVPVRMVTSSSWSSGTSFCARYVAYTGYLVPAEEVSADSIPFTFPVALPLEFR